MAVNPIKAVGIGVVYIGLGALFLMSIIGALSLDLLLLYVVSQNNRNNNFFANLIVTFWLWDRLMMNSERLYDDVGLMILSSPFITAITVGLSFLLGAPEFGLLLVAGWVGAFTILLAGSVIYGLGDVLESIVETLVGGLSSVLNSVGDYVDGLSSSQTMEDHYQYQEDRSASYKTQSRPPAYSEKQSYNDPHFPSPLHTHVASYTGTSAPPPYEPPAYRNF